MRELYLYWSGDERSGNYENQKHDFPICVTIGAHPAHAVGVGYTMMLEEKGRAAVVTIGGRGPTSKGDLLRGHERRRGLEAPGGFSWS